MLVARRHLFALWAVCAALSACGFDVSATPRVRVDAANAAQFTNAVWRAAAWRNERVHAPFVVRGTAGAGGFTARVVPETDRDAAVFAPTGLMLMDCAPVLRKWLGECRLAQRGELATHHL